MNYIVRASAGIGKIFEGGRKWVKSCKRFDSPIVGHRVGKFEGVRWNIN